MIFIDKGVVMRRIQVGIPKGVFQIMKSDNQTNTKNANHSPATRQSPCQGLRRQTRLLMLPWFKW